MHPLTSLVLDLFEETRRPIDRFDVAIALGAPDAPGMFGAYCQVADDLLSVMAHQGLIMADTTRLAVRFPYYIEQPTGRVRPYAGSRPKRGRLP